MSPRPPQHPQLLHLVLSPSPKAQPARALRHWERVTAASSLQPGPHPHNLLGPRSPNTCTLAASAVRAGGPQCPQCPAAARFRSAEGGAHLAPPPHALRGHQLQGLRHAPHSLTGGPNPAGSEGPRARPAAIPNTTPTQPTQSPPPGHAPLVTQCWLLPVHPARPRPSPRQQPPPPTPELLARRSRILRVYRPSAGLVTLVTAGGCAGGLRTGPGKRRPSPRPANPWLQVPLGRGLPPDLGTACRADTTARSSRALSFRFIYPETCLPSPTHKLQPGALVTEPGRTALWGWKKPLPPVADGCVDHPAPNLVW